MEVPNSDAPGIGLWAGARGSRQVSAPDAPLNPPHLSPETHSPSFYGEGEAGALKPDRGKRPKRRGGGRGRPAFALFGVAALGAALCCRWGPREARRGEPATAAASSPPRPVPQDCSCRRRVGKPEGGARRAAAAVLGAGRGAWMDFTACVSACVCSLRRRRRPGLARPVRPPRASEVRVPSPESGGGEREGAGEGRGGGGAITPSPRPGVDLSQAQAPGWGWAWPPSPPFCPLGETPRL